MKNHRIIDAMEYISDDKISDADKQPRSAKSKKPFFIAAGSVCAAAVAGVFLARSGLIFGGSNVPVDPDSSVSAPVSTNSGNATVPNDNFFIDYDNLPFEYDGRAAEKLNAGSPDFGAGGYEAYSADDVSDLIGSNPWNESLTITELPVFQYTGKNEDKEFDRVRSLLTGEFANAKIKKGAVWIDVIFPESLNEIPDWVDLDSFDGEIFERSCRYLADKYAKHFGYEDYTLSIAHDYLLGGDVLYWEKIYQNGGSAFESIINYNFNHANFIDISGEPLELRIWDLLSGYECAGFYPVIDADQARERLLAGDYITTVPVDGFAEESIKHVELIYNSTLDGYHLPYYRFLIQLDNNGNDHNLYGAFYVPAVSPEFLLS